MSTEEFLSQQKIEASDKNIAAIEEMLKQYAVINLGEFYKSIDMLCKPAKRLLVHNKYKSKFQEIIPNEDK